MSLNGLSDGAVVEAHQTALAEPGGWFLLKYVTRDTIQLLSRGSGGVSEARNAIHEYEELSPLYGLVQFRRKRIILKYVPEGTSRLLQVRLTVQFQSVLDAFAHDTVFSFSTAKELVESALGLNTLLQPTRNESLPSSNSSMIHRRLNEITEDNEETTAHPPPATASPFGNIGALENRNERMQRKPVMASLPESAMRAKMLLAARRDVESDTGSVPALESPTSVTPTPMMRDTATPEPLRSHPPIPRKVPSNVALDKALPAIPYPTQLPQRNQVNHVSSRGEEGKPSSRLARTELPPPPPPPPPANDPEPESEHEPTPVLEPIYITPSRHLSEHESNNISQWSQAVSSYVPPLPLPKSKKKLAPRPHMGPGNRMKSSTTVANLPQSVRATNRPGTAMSNARPSSRQSSRSVPAHFAARPSEHAPPVPQPMRLPSDSLRAPPNAGFAGYGSAGGYRKAPSAASTNMTDASYSTASPEKMRLMKALQIRKRNMLLAQRNASAQSTHSPTTQMVPPSPVDGDSPESLTPITIVATAREHVAPEAKASERCVSDATSPTSPTTASERVSTNPSSFVSEQYISKLTEPQFSPTPEAEEIAEGTAQVTPRNISTSGTEQMAEEEKNETTTMGTEATADVAEANVKIPNHTSLPAASDIVLTSPALAPLEPERFRVAEETSKDAMTLEELSAENVTPPAVSEPLSAQPKPESIQPLSAVPEHTQATIMRPRRTSSLALQHTDSVPRAQDEATAVVAAQESTATAAAALVTSGYLATPPPASLSNKRSRENGDIHMPNSDDVSDYYSEEEGFGAEIQNATVHKAKSIVVAKSPATPTSIHKLSMDKIRIVRHADIENDHSEYGRPQNAGTRSSSAAGSQWPPASSAKDEPVPLTKKGILGISISKRIKALENLTHRDSVVPSPPSPRDSSASRQTFTNLVNRSSFLASSQTGLKTINGRASPSFSQETIRSAAGGGSSEAANRPLVQRAGEVTELFSPAKMGDTVSVTARIIRDAVRPLTSASQLKTDPPRMHRSPLIVDQNPQDPVKRPPIPDVPASVPPKRSTERHSRFSISSLRSNGTAKHVQPEARSARSSTYKKHSKKGSDVSSVTTEKSSRTSRFMQRVSGLSSRMGGSNKVVSPSKETVAYTDIIEEPNEIKDPSEHDESTSRRPSIATTSTSIMQVVDIGDVNVQFPESLLWKRRFMRIDDQGSLIFSPPTDNSHIRAHRRYHLSELEVPALPDPEREEMAWSIVLDVKAGGSMQCACESRSAQKEILRMLLDAHDAYNSLYSN